MSTPRNFVFSYDPFKFPEDPGARAGTYCATTIGYAAEAYAEDEGFTAEDESVQIYARQESGATEFYDITIETTEIDDGEFEYDIDVTTCQFGEDVE